MNTASAQSEMIFPGLIGLGGFFLAIGIWHTAAYADITLNYDLSEGILFHNEPTFIHPVNPPTHQNGEIEDNYFSTTLDFDPIILTDVAGQNTLRIRVNFVNSVTGAVQRLSLDSKGTGFPFPETFATRLLGEPSHATLGSGMALTTTAESSGHDGNGTFFVTLVSPVRGAGDDPPPNPYNVPWSCSSFAARCETGSHFPGGMDLTDRTLSFSGLIIDATMSDFQCSVSRPDCTGVTFDGFNFALLAGDLAILEAKEFTVDTTADTPDADPGDGMCEDASGKCSLRAAIEETNANTTPFPNDIVNLPAGYYTLTLGQLAITDDLTLRGDGPDITIIDANNSSGAIRVGNTLYEQSVNTNPLAIANFEDEFANCLVSEGCYGKPALVVADGSAAQNNSHISGHINPITFNFPLTPAEIATVTGNSGRGVLIVTAARDLGRNQCTPNVDNCQADGFKPAEDWLETRVDDISSSKDFFKNTLSTCPPPSPPEGHNEAPTDFTCGPNFNNDFGATDSVSVSGSTIQSGASDGQITVTLTPTEAVGRLKIFGVELRYLKDLLVNISDLTIQNGNTNGGIRNDGGFVQISNIVVKDNDGGFIGGGILNSIGTMTLRNSTVSGNSSSRGGGILNGSLGVVTLTQSTVNDNTVTQFGGGIVNNGRLNLTNTTVSGNDAGIGGGGIQNTGIANITFSTVTENEANTRNTTFDNAVGGGISNALNGQVNISNSILAQNTDGRSSFFELFSPDCFSTTPFRFTSFRGNLVGILSDNCDMRDTIFGAPPNFDMFGIPTSPLSPVLGLLADNGGFTQTHALLVGSPAIDNGTGVTSSPLSECPDRDQREFIRPVDGDGNAVADCDVGSFEFLASMEGDLDSDGDVDRADLAILLLDRNKSVSESSCGTVCDYDGDGVITGLDARKLLLLCTRPRCATE